MITFETMRISTVLFKVKKTNYSLRIKKKNRKLPTPLKSLPANGKLTPIHTRHNRIIVERKVLRMHLKRHRARMNWDIRRRHTNT